MNFATTVNKIKVQDGCTIFYREAGSPEKPTMLLLHGFPTSSNMFRNLIPLLSPNFHVIAPDMPGFGFTEVPSSYTYNFASLAKTIDYFVHALELTKFAIYVFDYGAPVGFRLALKDPIRITGIVSQNGNIYAEGVDDKFWKTMKEYWKAEKLDPTYVEGITKFIEDPSNTVSQYLNGVNNPDSIDPATYTLDEALLRRPGQNAIQVSLFYDYKTNIELYPEFQRFLAEADVPVLLTWGKNDIIFNVAGAEGYRKDATFLKIVYLDAGHFALETHAAEISKEINEYLLPLLRFKSIYE